jgi:hypothetical protein
MMHDDSDAEELAELNWKLDRLPEITKELDAHGYAVVTKSSQDVGNAVVACLFHFGFFAAATLLAIGLSENKFIGAGVAIGLATLLMLALQVRSLYAQKYGQKKGN